MKVTLSTLATVLAAQRRAAKPAKARKKTLGLSESAALAHPSVETPVVSS